MLLLLEMCCRLNQLYTVLDEVGTWNASWTEVCVSMHSLAGQADCLQSNKGGVACYATSSGTSAVLVAP